MEKTKLTPIRFPADLLNDLDKYVNDGSRSKFIIEATRKELQRVKQRKAIQKAAGILGQNNYPQFKTAEDISDWVRKLRDESEARRKELFEQ
ncbi:MAG: hypothetical protein JL50_21180 [Peptococcaceae bacterium BICA1-7]|nr:MAG: hypothetical protein JL50_21180 [Peptococcaceae bacterium BICA1-7]HBV97160.1 hypothetical protein [Desulfotomaculum sp.]